MNKIKLFEVEEVCDMLHICKSTAYKLLRRGELPGRKIGGKWLIDVNKLEKYIKMNIDD
ncbi:MAG: helix-turn-helix domain-containing protein [Lachnospiraceae bacterium]|nr:helix-turn-helix domain-containing protein [Lachnospiraceae bacterium]